MKKRKITYSEFLPPKPREAPAPPPPEESAPPAAPKLDDGAAPKVVIEPAAAPTAVFDAPAPAVAVLEPPPVAGAGAGGAVKGFRARVEAGGGVVDLLLFRAGGEFFGLELEAVEEVLDVPDLHRIPEMPPALLGVFTLRGILVSLYAPDEVLGVTVGHHASVLVFHGGGRRLGLAVDDVDDVLTLELSALRDVPGADAGDGVLVGVARRGRDLIGVLDVEALLALLRAEHALEGGTQ